MGWREAFDLSPLADDDLQPFEWAFAQAGDFPWANTDDGKMVFQGSWTQIRFASYDELGGAAARYDGRILIGSVYRNTGTAERLRQAAQVLLHEAFHAWDFTHLSDRQRQQIMDLWGYRRWAGGSYNDQCGEAFARAMLVSHTVGPVADHMANYLSTWDIDPATFPQLADIIGVPLPGGELTPPEEPDIVERHVRCGLFQLVDPPDGQAEVVADTLDRIRYPFHRVIPAVREDPDQAVQVEWDPQMRGATGMFHGNTYTVVLGARYAGWQDKVPFVLAHEIGHLVDAATLTDDDRSDLLDLMHATPGRWDGQTLNGSEHPWSHAQPHTERWRTSNDYKFRPNEAFADVFVAAFAPNIWEGHYPRFAHWTDDLDAVRQIVLRKDIQVFDDVKPDSTHAEAILWAAAEGLVSGFEDGTFRPDVPVTRGQLATILYRQGGGPDG